MGRPDERRTDYGHEYVTADGESLPAVTTILDLVRIPALEAWKIRTARELGETHGWDAATAGIGRDEIRRYPEPILKDVAGRGSQAHRILADIARQRWDPNKSVSAVAGYVEAGRLFLNEHVSTVEAVEQFRSGTTTGGRRYGGVADLVASKDGRRLAVDWKAGVNPPPATCSKCSAYGAATAADGDGPAADIGVVVGLSDDGTYQTASVNMSDSWWQDMWDTTCDHYYRITADRYTHAADGSDELLDAPIRDMRPQPATTDSSSSGDGSCEENPSDPSARARYPRAFCLPFDLYAPALPAERATPLQAITAPGRFRSQSGIKHQIEDAEPAAPGNTRKGWR